MNDDPSLRSLISEGKNTFPKSEKLTGKKAIQELFQRGSSIFSYPYKVYFQTVSPVSPYFPQFLVSVPKRTFKSAVTRNLLKRLIREAYRLNKQLLAFEEHTHIEYIAFVFVGKEVLDYAFLEQKMKKVLEKVVKEL